MAYHNPSELDLVPNAYSPGMFHPVYAGEVYDQRYRVYRKLGFGMSATVWLVKDIATDHFYAMKVLSADCSGSTLQEIDILLHLLKADPTHPGHLHTSPLIDHFEHTGPNGTHKCLIFPVMAESLDTFRQKFCGECIPSGIVKRVTRQILSALEYAHGQGVIHTDIKADNVMIVLKDQSVITERYLPSTEGCMGGDISAHK